MEGRPLIGSHGGFRNLHCFRLAEVIFDATEVFCERFIDRKSRTTDQMIQLARSGKQNIAEGSADSATSKKIELKLTGIAPGCLVELQLDYQDFPRRSKLHLCDKEDPQCLKIRTVAFDQGKLDGLDKSEKSDPRGSSDLSNRSDPSHESHRASQHQRSYRRDISYALYSKFFEKTSPEIAANTAICHCHQATYLLNRLLLRLEKDFIEHGGFTERLYQRRKRKS